MQVNIFAGKERLCSSRPRQAAPPPSTTAITRKKRPSPSPDLGAKKGGKRLCMSRVPNRKSKVMVLFRTPLQVLNISDVEEDYDSDGDDDGGGIGQALQVGRVEEGGTFGSKPSNCYH